MRRNEGQVTGMPEHFKRISAEEFADLDCDEVTLLDLREEYEFERDGIEGSINLPMDRIGTRLSEVPKDKPVIVYCKIGLWSEAIAEVLADRGYDAATLEGGYNRYLGLMYGM
ncbi:MAG: rhodanese-like domain-containing protein [Clostridia bacterium]|nr:rhodanese-like domain-containing protein [Clostridia bacterium]MBQ6526565.1 rhodanese-like domain-containing protein [Clostridia bacterium]MBQ7228854.1 rhodanese-like domain-containing protein [Clostridia bacterium]